MSQEMNSQQSPEKFSFISALTISHEQDTDELEEADAIIPETATEDWEDLNQELASSLAPLGQSDTESLATFTPATISGQWYELNLNPAIAQLDLFSVVLETNSGYAPAKSKNYFDKIYFIAACGYLIGVLWWLLDYKNQNLADIFAFIPYEQQETVSQADAEFLDYMERSLETIDRKSLSPQAATNTESDTNATSNIVYVPVYTPNAAPQVPETANPLPIPLPPPPPPASLGTPATTPVAKITTPPPLQPQSEKPATTPTVSESATTAPPVTAKVTTPIKPAKNYTLVGLIEWGEKPTAMFKEKSGTKKVLLGENIADSGWKLEAIKERNVVISRQGESRTLDVGEKF